MINNYFTFDKLLCLVYTDKKNSFKLIELLKRKKHAKYHIEVCFKLKKKKKRKQFTRVNKVLNEKRLLREALNEHTYTRT